MYMIHSAGPEVTSFLQNVQFIHVNLMSCFSKFPRATHYAMQYMNKYRYHCLFSLLDKCPMFLMIMKLNDLFEINTLHYLQLADHQKTRHQPNIADIHTDNNTSTSNQMFSIDTSDKSQDCSFVNTANPLLFVKSDCTVHRSRILQLTRSRLNLKTLKSLKMTTKVNMCTVHKTEANTDILLWDMALLLFHWQS